MESKSSPQHDKLMAQSGQVLKEIEKQIVGQHAVMKELLIGIMVGGHCLIEGVPGLAKTLMIKSLGEVLDLKFNRVQFTPDLMPSDILGLEIMEENRESRQREFRFIKGPIFTNLLLADEINRTPPKTQSALLQAMQEYQVTVSGKDYGLDLPFLVMATQNPLEQEGTYPLPEAQLDRFMFKVFVDYPKEEEEMQIVSRTTGNKQAPLVPVLTAEEIRAFPDLIRQMPVSEHVLKYAVKLVRKTRPGLADAPPFIKEFLSFGAGPRAGQSLILAAKANAVLRGSYSVSEMDIRAMAKPVLNHRIVTNFSAEAEGKTTINIIEQLIEFLG